MARARTIECTTPCADGRALSVEPQAAAGAPSVNGEAQDVDWAEVDDIKHVIRGAAYTAAHGVDVSYLFRGLADHDGRIRFKQFMFAIRRAKVSIARASDAQLDFLFQLMDVEGLGKLHVDDAELLLSNRDQLRRLYFDNLAVSAASSPKARSPTCRSPTNVGSGTMFTRRTNNMGLPKGQVEALRPPAIVTKAWSR